LQQIATIALAIKQNLNNCNIATKIISLTAIMDAISAIMILEPNATQQFGRHDCIAGRQSGCFINQPDFMTFCRQIPIVGAIIRAQMKYYTVM
jgi:hypothetical protein